MTMLKSKQQIAVAIEANAGVAETLDATDVVIHNDGTAEFEAIVQQTQRETLSASLSRRGSVIGTQEGVIRFKQFLRGTSGAPADGSNEPDWLNIFRTGGLSPTFSGTPTAEQISCKPSSTLITDETAGGYATVGLYEDGKLFQIRGAQCNIRWTLTDGMPILAEYEYHGVFTTPTDVALLVPTYTSIIEPPFLGASLSVLGYAAARIRSLTFDLGNEIVMRPDPNDPEGLHAAQIVRRNVIGTLDPEEVLAATKNWWLEWLNGTSGSITTGVFPSGGTNYNQFSFEAPKGSYLKVGLGERDGYSAAPIEFECQANSDAGDDELEIILT